ncbi:hypothetical protein HELRODRAFT_179191 [Helobdella robusta]|uniref:Uncharacterized protein n=1 Tax=Helobdella robusta TaxID=6412 RepID=T1FEC0_HELRO|nr:hypothetical protein HELRODRAFT_179191 [Helobdella robusta]ESN95714.1 hypothetical protein HELRODRAFT_179191 [Helobdella robusta]
MVANCITTSNKPQNATHQLCTAFICHYFTLNLISHLSPPSSSSVLGLTSNVFKTTACYQKLQIHSTNFSSTAITDLSNSESSSNNLDNLKPVAKMDVILLPNYPYRPLLINPRQGNLYLVYNQFKVANETMNYKIDSITGYGGASSNGMLTKKECQSPRTMTTATTAHPSRATTNSLTLCKWSAIKAFPKPLCYNVDTNIKKYIKICDKTGTQIRAHPI